MRFALEPSAPFGFTGLNLIYLLFERYFYAHFFVSRAQLPALGISPNNISFSNVTMESSKFICVREPSTVATTPSTVVIIEMEKPHSPVRRPITADSAIMNPRDNILALRGTYCVDRISISAFLLRVFLVICPLSVASRSTRTLNSFCSLITCNFIFHSFAMVCSWSNSPSIRHWRQAEDQGLPNACQRVSCVLEMDYSHLDCLGYSDGCLSLDNR